MTLTVSDNIDYNVLIVDNDQELMRMLLQTFASHSVRGTVATTRDSACKYLDGNKPDLAFICVEPTARTDNGDGLYILRRIRADYPEMPVIAMAGENATRQAIDALNVGCAEFIVKPLSQKRLDEIMRTLLPDHRTNIIATLQNTLLQTSRIVGASEELAHIVNLARRVAPTSAPVLIHGQSGTGKELIAQLIHDHSARGKGPFLKVNCAALNESLLESELFGHEKGAFTGAYSRFKGKFEQAHGGTLLLDEITETPPHFQAKLLRVLEEMSFQRVGGTDHVDVNVRIISTTNTAIVARVRNGQFRSDLYYRLAGVRLHIPPLRNRRDDIEQLTWYFITCFAPEAGRSITSIDTSTMELFYNCHWPGNVRQLKNVVRTALILGSGQILSLTDAPWLIDELADIPDAVTRCEQTTLQSLREIERRAILTTLNKTDGNQTQAAKVLGISGRTLREKIKKYRQQQDSVTVTATATAGSDRINWQPEGDDIPFRACEEGKR